MTNSPAKPVKTPDTFGTAEEGCWTVHPSSGSDHGVSWGPFSTKTEAVAFMVEVNPENMFAVNMTELPDFFNV